MSDGMPLWRCAVCGHEWGSLSLDSEVRDPSERRSEAPVDERIARLETPEGAEQFAINVEAMGLPALALAARRRAVELRAAAHGAKTAAEREALEAVYAYERVRTTTSREFRASRTWHDREARNHRSC